MWGRESLCRNLKRGEKSGTRYRSSREAATWESPARQFREGKVEQAGVPSGTAPSCDTVSGGLVERSSASPLAPLPFPASRTFRAARVASHQFAAQIECSEGARLQRLRKNSGLLSRNRFTDTANSSACRDRACTVSADAARRVSTGNQLPFSGLGIEYRLFPQAAPPLRVAPSHPPVSPTKTESDDPNPTTLRGLQPVRALPLVPRSPIAFGVSSPVRAPTRAFRPPPPAARGFPGPVHWTAAAP